jgi:hypothetical protein
MTLREWIAKGNELKPGLLLEFKDETKYLVGHCTPKSDPEVLETIVSLYGNKTWKDTWLDKELTSVDELYEFE